MSLVTAHQLSMLSVITELRQLSGSRPDARRFVGRRDGFRRHLTPNGSTLGVQSAY
jgi:hypothetical protein